MQRSLRVLNVEDSPRDEALLRRHLASAGYNLPSWQRVDTAAGMSEALTSSHWDIVLCDYAMPNFDALKALNLLRKSGIDLPFIIISGTVGEEVAVEAMLSGANDYLSKDNLARLIPAIERELKEAQNRRELRAAEVARRISEERYRTLFEYAPDGIIISTPDGRYLDANTSMCRMLGYEHHDLIGRHASGVVIDSEVSDLGADSVLEQTTPEDRREWYFRRKDGSEFPAEVIATIMPDGNRLAVIRDISESKKAAELLSEIAREKAESLALIGTILSRAPIGFAFHDRELRYVRINETLAAINGLSVEEHLGRSLLEILPKMSPVLDPIMRGVVDTGEPVVDFELSGETSAEPGKLKHWLVSFYPVGIDESDVLGVGVLVSDVTERRKSEEELRESEEKFSGAFEFAPIGFALVLPDGSWLKVNRALCQLTGYTESELLNLTFQDITHPDDLGEDLSRVRRLLEGELTYYQMEKRYIHKLGHIVLVSINVTLIRDREGSPLYFITQVQDVTARKRAEDELRESESLLSASQRITHLGSWVMDIADSGEVINNTERWSDEYYRIFGFEPDEIEITDQDFYNSVHPDDREALAKMLRQTVEHQQPHDLEHRITLPDGTERIVHAMAEVVVDVETGKPLRLLGSVQDVTERKRAEDELSGSEERYRLLFEKNPQPMWVFESKTLRFLEVNDAAINHYGYTRDEFLSMTILDVRPPEDIPALLRAVKNDTFDLLTGQSWRHCKKDRTVIDVEVASHSFTFGGIPAKLVLANDITERKSAEEALSRSEERYRDLVENAIDIIYTLDIDGNYTSVNKACEKITGFLREQSLTRSMFDSIAPEYREIGAQALAAHVAGKDMPAYELELIAKDGHRIAIEVNTRPIIEDGFAVGVHGIARDVTERKLTQAALIESEERYRELVENAIDIIYTHDLDGHFTSVNKAAETITGFSKVEILGMNIADAIPIMGVATAKEIIEAKLAGEGAPVKEVELRTKDGRGVIVEVNSRIVYENGSPVGLQGIARDITDRKLAAAELQEKSALLEAQLNSSIDGILVVDKDGRQVIRNQRFVDVFDMPQSIAGDPDDAKQVQWVTGIMKDPNQFIEKVEYLYSHPNEVSRDEIELTNGTFLDRYSAPVKGKDNKNYGRIWTFRDVTERKLAEDALRESETRLRTIIATEPECVKLLASDGSLLEMNPAGLRMFEADSFEEVAQRSVFGLIAKQDRKAFQNLTDKVFRGESGMLEFQIVGLKGTQRWLDTHASPLLDGSGKITALLGITRDITESKRATEALRESDEKFHQLADNISDAFWIRSPDMSKIYYISPAYEQIWGRKLKSDYADPHEWSEFILPQDRQNVKEAYAGLMNDRPEIEVEFRILRPDGEQRWVRARGFQVNDSSGEVIRLAGIVTDITEKKHVEAALKNSEFRYHSLFENMIEGYAYCETVFEGDDLRDFIYTEVNGAFEELTGLANVVGRNVSEIVPGARESSPQLFEVCGRVALTGKPEKFETYIEPLESWLCITVYSSSRENFVAVFDNITGRKLAEASLVESQEQLTLATESASLGIWDWDLVEDTMKWAPRMYELYGNYDEDFSGASATWKLNVHPDDSERVFAEYATAIECSDNFHSEFRVVWPNGEVRHLESSAKVLRDENGTALHFIGVNWDITERKVAEETLREADQRAIREYGLLLTRVSKLALALGNARDLESVFEELREFARVSTGMDGLVISLYDAKQKTRTAAYVWNEGVKVHAPALPPMEMSDSPHSRAVLTGEIIITDDFQSAMENQPVLHLGGDLPQSSLVVPMSVMGKIVGGVEVQSNHLAAFTDSHATAMQMAANLAANAIDNVRLMEKDRKQADQLRQSQKIEAVGVLAGGIAHDFNNLLTVINGYSALTLKKMSGEDPLRQNIQEVKKAGDRAAELTSQLLAFSRKQVLNPVVHNLNPVIANIENMLRRMIKENIELTTFLEADLGNVKADPGQVEQIVMNLAVNARDAMPDGGKLTIETANVYLDEKYVGQNLTVSPGPFVKLTVTDTGTGMDAKTKQQIFEPFFTTKEVGKGTGLGLSMVHGIVKQSGGDIMVYSEPGHGSAFKIYFPCVDEDVHVATGKDETELSGTETILVVEDEEVVRNLVVEILSGSGYKVLTAESGQDGLNLFQTLNEPVHLLLTDVIMPIMGGAELKERIVALKPATKVLFMSGYSDEAISSKGVLDADSALIEKPFSPVDLARKVREVLDFR